MPAIANSISQPASQPAREVRARRHANEGAPLKSNIILPFRRRRFKRETTTSGLGSSIPGASEVQQVLQILFTSCPIAAAAASHKRFQQRLISSNDGDAPSAKVPFHNSYSASLCRFAGVPVAEKGRAKERESKRETPGRESHFGV